MMRSGAIKGAGPFFSGREPHVPAIQSYPTPKQIYLHVTPPTGNSQEANNCYQNRLKSYSRPTCIWNSRAINSAPSAIFWRYHMNDIVNHTTDPSIETTASASPALVSLTD